MRLAHVGGCMGAPEVFSECFGGGHLNITSINDVGQLTGGDILMLGGGEDIHPSSYGMPVSRYTLCNAEASKRDKLELLALTRAMALDIPVYGICRGAQMLSAFLGATLVQHVNGHGGNHMMKLNPELSKKILAQQYGFINSDDDAYKQIETNSVHHQMIFPWCSENEFVIWGHTTARSPQYYFSEKYSVQTLAEIDPKEFTKATLKTLYHAPPSQVDPEIIYWPKQNWLAVQAHPEFTSPGSADRMMYVLLMEYIQQVWNDRS